MKEETDRILFDPGNYISLQHVSNHFALSNDVNARGSDPRDI